MPASKPFRCSEQFSFHVWMPEIFSNKGGIQTYSAFLLDALQNLCPDSGYDVFLKHDTYRMLDMQQQTQTWDRPRFHFAGQWPIYGRTIMFASQLILEGWRHRPDLIIMTHIHFAKAAYWLKRLTGVPYWVVAHGIESWAIRDQHLCKAVRNADRILAVSSYTRDRLAEQLQLHPKSLGVLPNTFNEKRFQIGIKPDHLLQRYGLTADQPVILTVARLAGPERYKGYDQVLYALPQIMRSIPNIHYIIAGKGDDRGRIEELVAALNLHNNVTLAGFVPDEELCDHYNLCDLFAMPSKGEGFGIVYLEALACGKPTLGGNQDGTTDALRHGQLGVLVDPDNVTKLAQAIIDILQGTYPHDLLYQPQALRQAVIDTFGFAKFTQQLAHHLDSLSIQTIHSTNSVA